MSPAGDSSSSCQSPRYKAPQDQRRSLLPKHPPPAAGGLAGAVSLPRKGGGSSVMLESLLQHRQGRDGTRYLQPLSLQPARAFINSEQFQEDPLDFRAAHGTWERWDGGSPVLRGHEPSWWQGRGRGTLEHPARTETLQPPGGSEARLGLQSRRCGVLPPAPSLPIPQGFLLPFGECFPGAVCPNTGERRARLPAAVWRGATACLFPSCLQAPLLHASGFLAALLLLLLLLN